MSRKATAIIFACSALAIAGCSSDDNSSDDGGVDGNGDTGAPVEELATAGIYRISVTNLIAGQPMTPPVVAIHGTDVRLFEIGTAASPQLAEIAENGENGPMVELAGSLDSVTAAGVAFADAANPGPFFEGETATIILETDAADQVFSVVNMVVCTNDGFAGVDSRALPTGSDVLSFETVPYDGGTELNELDPEYWVGACGGSGANLHEDEGAVTGPHPGQAGTDGRDFDGSAPAVRIEVERLESVAGSFEISFTNLSIGQPMTPPVAAIHDPSVSLFTIGTAASPELQAIAEDGNNAPMVALATSLAEVSAAGVAFVDAANPGPMQPGEIATVILETAASTGVFSAVNMVVCTNDGFAGVDSVNLPTGTETVTFQAVPYDAGTELNELNADYWVPPCGGNGENLHEDENGVTGPHLGQTGTGNFDFVGTDAILSVSITRVVETTEGEGEGEGEGAGEGEGEGAGEGEGGESGGGESGEGAGGGAGGVTPGAGTAQAALESAGTFGNFLPIFGGPTYDDPANVWTVFAFTDASIPAGVTPDGQNHVFVGGALTEAELLANGEITTNGGISFPVTGSEGAVFVSGNAISFLATGDGGAIIYSIDGVL